MKLLVNITRHDLKLDGFSINSINIIHMQIRYVHYLIINFISTMIIMVELLWLDGRVFLTSPSLM